MKKVAFIPGRFNPPHIGHYSVVSKVKKFIRNNPEYGLDPVPVVIIIDGKKTGQDKQRNPLSPDQRISFMQASGLADGVRFIVANDFIDACTQLRKMSLEPTAVAAGSDRTSYKKILDKYFKEDANGNPIKHFSININRVESKDEGLDKTAGLDTVLDYLEDELPVDLASASLARRAVERNERDKFKIITGLSKVLADKLFDKIKSAMGTSNGAS